jgi:hypothetical protein
MIHAETILTIDLSTNQSTNQSINQSTSQSVNDTCTCAHARTYACIYTHAHTYTCTHAHIRTHTHRHTHTGIGAEGGVGSMNPNVRYLQALLCPLIMPCRVGCPLGEFSILFKHKIHPLGYQSPGWSRVLQTLVKSYWIPLDQYAPACMDIPFHTPMIMYVSIQIHQPFPVFGFADVVGVNSIL